MLVLGDLTSFGEGVLVPLAGIFCLFGLPTLAFVFFRVLAHRERVEMIRSGFAPGSSIPGGLRGVPRHANEAASTTLRKGITLSFIGLAITIGLSFIGISTETPAIPLPGLLPVTTWHPGPWLLGGLVPLFVGLAQVVIALLSGATLRPTSPTSPTYGAADRAEHAAPYRPGETQELRPPRTPPERRA